MVSEMQSNGSRRILIDVKRTNRCECISLWTRFICFSFAILLTSGFTTSKEKMVSDLKKTGSALLFEALTKTESMRANFEHEQISNSGKTVVLKAQLFLGDLIDLNGKLKNHIINCN